MKKLLPGTLLLLSMLAFSCYSVKNINTSYAKNRNICKELKGKVLVYMVFVDSKDHDLWTDFDINTAFKSAGEAADWLMASAKKNNVQMDIEIKYFQSGKMRTVALDLPAATVAKSLSFPSIPIGIYRLNKWADKVAGAVGKKVKFPGEVDNSIIKKPKDNVELISKLRDIYRVENVALIYLLNNNFTNDISIVLNTTSDKQIEYAVASYKSPTTLAREILKLFGAQDFKEDPFKKGKSNDAAIAQWPNDIMSNAKDPLEKLELGSLTQYLVGWKNTPDSAATRLLSH